MAPAAVLDQPFTFETIGGKSLRATFHNAGFTVSAILIFNDAGDLVGFTSDDRAHDREGGAATWSTPISRYRLVDGIRMGALGDTVINEPVCQHSDHRWTTLGRANCRRRVHTVGWAVQGALLWHLRGHGHSAGLPLGGHCQTSI